jgi:hypothetical protein
VAWPGRECDNGGGNDRGPLQFHRGDESYRATAETFRPAPAAHRYMTSKGRPLFLHDNIMACVHVAAQRPMFLRHSELLICSWCTEARLGHFAYRPVRKLVARPRSGRMMPERKSALGALHAEAGTRAAAFTISRAGQLLALHEGGLAAEMSSPLRSASSLGRAKRYRNRERDPWRCWPWSLHL